MSMSKHFTVHNIRCKKDEMEPIISDIAVVTDRPTVKILVADRNNPCLRLYNTTNWNCNHKVNLHDFPECIAVDMNGPGRIWVSNCQYEYGLYEIKRTRALTVGTILKPGEYIYSSIAYLDTDRLAAVFRYPLPVVNILSLTGDILLDVTKWHGFNCPMFVTCYGNDVIVADTGEKVSNLSTGGLPHIVCLTITGPGSDIIVDVKWVHMLNTVDRPVRLTTIMGTLVVLCVSDSFTGQRAGKDILLQLGIDHGDKLSVFPLPTGCPKTRGALCGYGNKLYVCCEGQSPHEVIVELQCLGNHKISITQRP
jgi:hypothetical protein